MAVLLFVHIVLMFAAVGLAGTTSALLVVAARTNQLERLGPVIAAFPVTKILPPLFILGGLAGLATAYVAHYPLLSPWLVLAYVGFGAGVLLGALGSGRLITRLGEGADPSVLARPIQIDFMLNVALYTLLIADMVFRPFS